MKGGGGLLGEGARGTDIALPMRKGPESIQHAMVMGEGQGGGGGPNSSRGGQGNGRMGPMGLTA